MEEIVKIFNKNYGLFKKAIEKWGNKLQLDMVIEELAELIVAINHYKREVNVNNKLKIAEETADVLIMIEQLIFILDINNVVKSYINSKLDRLEERLEKKLVDEK
ncbi:MAG: hypothetical protein ACTSQJ_00445 [Promethearchaeota archaeon]